ncbi:uncharacterized protein ACIBXB_020459 [Morphnus guianensis]
MSCFLVAVETVQLNLQALSVNKETKPNLKTPSPHASLLPGHSFTPKFSTSSALAAQGDGEWALQSVRHTLSLLLLPPQGENSSLVPCSGVGSLPPETVLHELLQCESFPQAAVLLELLQRGSLPWAAVLQAQTAPAWVPRGVTNSARSLLQRGLPTGSQPPSGIPLLRCGVLPGLQVEICSAVDLHGLQGDSLPHHGLPRGLQGNLCSGAWSISSPPSALTWGAAGLFLSHVLTPLSLAAVSVPQQLFFPLLRSVIPEVLPLSLMGSALSSSGSVLEPAGIGSVGHGGSFWHLLTESTPVAPPPPPPLPKPCHADPIHVLVYIAFQDALYFSNFRSNYYNFSPV